MNKHVILLLFFVVSSHQLVGQNNDVENETQDSTNTHYTGSLLVRGKALGGVFIEDLYMGNITLGLEYRIGQHHSFGVDAIAMKYWFERDLWYPVTGEELGHGHFAMDSRFFILMDYRLYMHPNFAQNGEFTLYVNPYYRRGWARLWKENDFIYEENDIITGSDQYHDYGFNVGIRTGSLQSHRFGFDASIGIMNRIKIENHLLYIDDETTSMVVDRVTEFLMPNLRTNFYFYLFRKEGKK